MNTISKKKFGDDHCALVAFEAQLSTVASLRLRVPQIDGVKGTDMSFAGVYAAALGRTGGFLV